MQSGGITRFKFHLSCKEVYKNVKVCPNVPPKVKKQISQLQKNKETKKKAKKEIEEIQQELRGNLSDTEEEDDMYNYPEDLHPDEWDDYRSAIDTSKTSKWQREQVERIFGGRSKREESSGAGGSSQPP